VETRGSRRTPVQDETSVEHDLDERRLQLLQLRLPHLLHRVHVVREQGPSQTEGAWSGAERLFALDGRVLGAFSPGRLVREYAHHGGAAPLRPPTLMLDVRRAGRALGRAEHRWSGEIRGTFADVDDVFFDAAFSIGDVAAGGKVRDAEGFHAQYDYIWGVRPTPLPPAIRLKAWDQMVAWFLGRLAIVDRFDRRFVRQH
jgi:hypothetical protein